MKMAPPVSLVIVRSPISSVATEPSLTAAADLVRRYADSSEMPAVTRTRDIVGVYGESGRTVGAARRRRDRVGDGVAGFGINPPALRLRIAGILHPNAPNCIGTFGQETSL